MFVTAAAADLYPHEWAVVDVETSGLRASQHRILSVAAITIDRQGREHKEFSTLLDPGCDPGPVHIHGLTSERLRGAPRFEQIAARVAALLEGRVMVAHNAQFDYDFLAREFAAAGIRIPVEQRLCTVALNRRIAPATPDLKLGTLVDHYGVAPQPAHTALGDTRMLAGVLRASLRSAALLAMPLPLVECPPRQSSRYPVRVPKARCAFSNPGPLNDRLVQGMKIAITGETQTPRLELVARAVAAGLNVMNNVSRHTSVLVANDAATDTLKADKAREAGVPVIDEDTFVRLLHQVQPGQPVQDKAPRVPAPRTAPAPAPTKLSGPLAGHRVLVLGGSHERAASAREKIVEFGGAASVNLSKSVTDVLLLDGADQDRRMDRIRTLDVALRTSEWLFGPKTTPAQPAPTATACAILARGHVTDLPGSGRWTISASWAHQSTCDVDVVAFAVDTDQQVATDDDFVFYGAPESPDGTIALSTNGPAEQAVTLDLAALPAAVHKVVIAASIDGPATFGDVGAIEITAASGSMAPAAEAALDAATTERTLILAEVYRREGTWRLRAVGQGYDHGLAELARGHGVDVAD
ncbi:TerD family protein [Actinocorallia sp. A-T 12471]|uniref:TerD family protein n=1 Tax=Actinocorallia sp. A-T 12471 TaxID=3089813 RepID=UPI0029CD6936|nr:TerD family protein [Actinocorallia sp. A-T 12471]MDX6741440.1 TerD family protein [Actinocorallia sp. A-T 12471]